MKYNPFLILSLFATIIFSNFAYSDSTLRLGYLSGKTANHVNDLDGFALKGKFDINNSFYAVGGLATYDIDSNDSFVSDSLDEITLGLGWNKPFSESMSFYSELQVLNLDTQFDDLYGYRWTNGFKGLLGSALEYYAEFDLEKINGVERLSENVGAEVGLYYSLNNKISIGGALRDSSAIGRAFRFDIRFDF